MSVETDKPRATTEESSRDVKPDIKREEPMSAEPTIAVKQEVQDVKPEKEAKKEMSGRQVLQGYLAGQPASQVMYRKLCSAMKILGSWTPEAKLQVIEQFIPAVDLLNDQCKELVSGLANVGWHRLPDSTHDIYLKLLGDIAIRQVVHTETIYLTAIKSFMPLMTLDDETGTFVRAYPEEKDDQYFTLAHRLIAHILHCFPSSHAALLKCIRISFPHHVQNSAIYVPFVRNMIQLAEYATVIANDVWDLIIQRILICDSVVRNSAIGDKKDQETDTEMFLLDEELEEMSKCNSANEAEADNILKLDLVMEDILGFIAVKNDLDTNTDMLWFRSGNQIDADVVLRLFCAKLESQLLLAVDVKYVSFIWLYLGSISEKHCSLILDLLWNTIFRPQRNQCDAKKAHGAAAFLAAFIARAKYIKAEVALVWIHRMLQWCIRYIENVHITQSSAGSVRHGLFYAVCQSFFISFCFRYREFVKNGNIDEIRRWSIGRVVHSGLEPLRYVNRPVAQCFGSITRSLQLVYCNHVVGDNSGVLRPFEAMFPFDSYRLSKSGVFVCPLMRRFSPLAEDKEALSTALSTKPKEEESMDFLEDDDLMLASSLNRHDPYVAQNSLLTVYSTSPGLRHFESSMGMY